jgi:hypothetical protein
MYFKWVHFHHGVMSSRDADGGNGLQVWWVTANILDKESRTADRGGPTAWGLGVGLRTPPLKNNIITNVTQGLFWINDLT